MSHLKVMLNICLSKQSQKVFMGFGNVKPEMIEMNDDEFATIKISEKAAVHILKAKALIAIKDLISKQTNIEELFLLLEKIVQSKKEVL